MALNPLHSYQEAEKNARAFHQAADDAESQNRPLKAMRYRSKALDEENAAEFFRDLARERGE